MFHRKFPSNRKGLKISRQLFKLLSASKKVPFNVRSIGCDAKTGYLLIALINFFYLYLFIYLVLFLQKAESWGALKKTHQHTSSFQLQFTVARNLGISLHDVVQRLADIGVESFS